MLPDVLDYDMKIVFCGTAVGNKSAEVKAYYAGKGNKFWPILHKTSLIPIRLYPEDYEKLRLFQLGLSDLVKNKSGNDSGLQSCDYGINSFAEKIIKYQPQILCFNGKEAAKRYLDRKKVDFGFQQEYIGETKIFVAPSTSGSANGSWDEKFWMQLSESINRN